jgi:heterodisulfide reductase subunit A
MEQHPKLNPVGTPNPCMFIAGTCAGPKDIPQSVAQASAAAAGAVSLLSQDRIILEAITAEIDADTCTGCRTCVGVCPYGALKFDEELNRACLDEGLCRGCGTCVASCPSNAIDGGHFTDTQLMAELEGILKARGPWEAAPAPSGNGAGNGVENKSLTGLED